MQLVIFIICYYGILSALTFAIDRRNKIVNSKEMIESRYQLYMRDRRKIITYMVRPGIDELLES